VNTTRRTAGGSLNYPVSQVWAGVLAASRLTDKPSGRRGFRMAFVPFVGEGDTFDFQYSTNSLEHVVTCQVGYDNVTDITYSILVTLSPPAGAYQGEFEIAFCVVEYDHDEECEYTVWDGGETRKKIEMREHRDMITNAICNATQILIEEGCPQIVSMMTYTPHLPHKALQKMHAVASVFAKAGFTVGQSDPYHGRHIWMMERAS
jgi:hypothetical protein